VRNDYCHYQAREVRPGRHLFSRGGPLLGRLPAHRVALFPCSPAWDWSETFAVRAWMTSIATSPVTRRAIPRVTARPSAA